MANLTNPTVQIVIFSTPIINIKDEYIDVYTRKDLEEEPNECSVEIKNLNSSTRNLIKQACYINAPIRVYATAADQPEKEPNLIFSGELDSCENTDLQPGFATEINATSNKINHRNFNIDKTFAAGTPIATVITDFIDAIGLPYDNSYDAPKGSIGLSESFSGPAFPLLRDYLNNFALRCFVVDGRLSISDIYTPPKSTVFEITNDLLLEESRDTSREDASEIQSRAVIETSGRSPFQPKNNKRKRKTKSVKVTVSGVSFNHTPAEVEEESGNFVEHVAVDQTIVGKDFELRAQPNINPDSMVSYENLQYRVVSVEHIVSNYGGDYRTRITTNAFDVAGDDDVI